MGHHTTIYDERQTLGIHLQSRKRHVAWHGYRTCTNYCMRPPRKWDFRVTKPYTNEWNNGGPKNSQARLGLLGMPAGGCGWQIKSTSAQRYWENTHKLWFGGPNQLEQLINIWTTRLCTHNDATQQKEWRPRTAGPVSATWIGQPRECRGNESGHQTLSGGELPIIL